MLDLGTIVIDSGILGEPLDIVPDIDHAEAATYGGTTIEALQKCRQSRPGRGRHAPSTQEA